MANAPDHATRRLTDEVLTHPRLPEIEKAIKTATRAMARRLKRPQQNTDDALQEVWLRIISSGSLLEALRHENPAAYIATIAYRTAIDELRRADTTRLVTGSETALDQALAGSPDEDERRQDAAELAAVCTSILDELAPENRDVLVLRYVQGLSASDTALRLGLSSANVRQRCLRALALLRRRLYEPR